MTNTASRARTLAENLNRMGLQRSRAQLMGFTDAGEVPGSLRHTSGEFELSVTDEECSWRLSLRERRLYRGREFFVETGSLDLSNLTPVQFHDVLFGLLRGRGFVD